MIQTALSQSRALWNRSVLALESDEVLAQLLDRGEKAAWSALYDLLREDPVLRRRVRELIYQVPLTLPRFWLAVLVSLGETVDFQAPLPDYMADSI